MRSRFIVLALAVPLVAACQGQGVGLSETSEEALAGGAVGAAGGALVGALAGAPVLGAALGGTAAGAVTALSEDINV